MNRTDATIVAVSLAVLDTIAETGDQGAPAGPLYAALMTVGVNFDTFSILMASLVRLGHLTRRGDLYIITVEGKQLLAKTKFPKKTTETPA